MATTNAYLLTAGLRHAIFVRRFAGSQLKQMLPFLERVKRSTAGVLASKELTDFSERRLKAIYKEIDGITVEIYDKMGKKLKTNMKEFAAYENDFNKRMFNKSTDVNWNTPTDKLIKAAVFSEPVAMLQSKGLNMDDLLGEYSARKGSQLVRTIQDGVIAGKTNGDIIKDMSFITDTSMANGLEALVRSVTGFVSNVARDEFYKENSDIVSQYKWVSALDNSTCEVCGALDGQVFEVGDGPLPVMDTHFGCRCTTTAIVDPKYSIRDLVATDRPAIGAEGVELDVSSKTTYRQWIATQPAAFQDEVLGVNKGALFREGGLKLDKFVDENYKPVTLKELAESDDKHIIKAFKKAGLADDE